MVKENSANLEQNKHDEPMTHMAHVVTTGFFGGIFWSIIGFIAYYFNFTSVGPALILNPIELGDWKNESLGQFIGIILIGIISIGVAIAYNAILQKKQSIWISALFGIALCAIVFYLLNPIFPGLDPINELSFNTIVTTVCLYILYGVFIGYSVSYDAQEMKSTKVNYSNG